MHKLFYLQWVSVYWYQLWKWKKYSGRSSNFRTRGHHMRFVVWDCFDAPWHRHYVFVVIVENKTLINVCWLHGYYLHVMQSKLTETPPLKKTGIGWGCTSPWSAFGYMYINGGTIIVGNDLKIGGMGEAKKETIPQFPMSIYPIPPKGSSISLSTNKRLSYGI